MHDSVPETWRVVRLGEVITLSRGKDLPVQNRSQGQYPVVGSNGIVGYHSAMVASGPGVLVGRSGSVGEVAYIEEDYWPLNTTLWGTDFHGNDTRFVAFFLQYLDLGRFTGGVSVPTLNRNILHRLEVCLPPVPEQQAIAYILHTIQTAKKARQRELALERERKAALMKYLFTHGTRGEATKQSEIGEIPESWAVTPLNLIADLFSGGTPSKSRPEWWKGSIPWVSTKDLKKPRLSDVTDHITAEAVQEGSRLVPANSLFVGIRGMILAKGIPVCLATVPMAFNQDVKAVVPRKGISPDFLLYAMNFFKSALTRHIGTSAHGTKRISGDAIATLGIPLPPAGEQKLIANTLTACDEKLVALSQELTLLSELFNALLEELMTGKVAVAALIDRGLNA